jgi:DNA-binding MarR family transcriptional regulator
MARPVQRIAKTDYEALAAWRDGLRRFLRFSQDAARAAGLPPQQHQALLAIKGFTGRNHMLIGELATSLQLRHHSVVGLIDRLVRRQLVCRSVAEDDRRQVEVRLTPQGESLVRTLSVAHLEELRRLQPELRRLLRSLRKH